ncbi:hypothetical protein V495_06023 [Pseudogymnoascus sp. VKM F-4514 (FW-929)]|nr:hypothetical protein V495_06023 [Pseudogymnoascus sp. VKM F-4514 (FW-929)]KFY57427.1 hypothetical protein V497_05569 [Pseudogymnoascus sp. VKM F-4516 (FW-969)]
MQILALLPIVALVAAHNNPEQPTTDIPEFTDPTTTITYDTTWPSTDLPGTVSTILTNPTRSEEPTTTITYINPGTVSTTLTNPTRSEEPTTTIIYTNPSQPPPGSTVTVTVTNCPVYPNTTFTRAPPVPSTPSGGGPGPTSPPGGDGPHPNGASTLSYMGANVLVGVAGVVILAGLL